MTIINKIFFNNSQYLKELDNESVDLVVTSPPYPMIEMWDICFSDWDPKIKIELELLNGNTAFELMHKKLDLVWAECERVLKPGSFACINIGDATRKIGEQFKLYSNHSRIIKTFSELGFDCLPLILWRKQTNAPNKFMGSGMLPSGAYVTLEHEYILVFRKGNKRIFKSNERIQRQESAFFWEERNVWFSDIWDFKGIGQKISSEKTRNRSAAYPLELVNRIINMYSLKNETILDPFLGTGTTLNSCILNKRKCIGFEIDDNFKDIILQNAISTSKFVNDYITKRINNHISFVKQYTEKKGTPKYTNIHYNFPVITNQEKNLLFETLNEISIIKNEIICNYAHYKHLNNTPKIYYEDKSLNPIQPELFTA